MRDIISAPLNMSGYKFNLLSPHTEEPEMILPSFWGKPSSSNGIRQKKPYDFDIED